MPDLNRKLKRIILDLEDLEEERFIDEEAEDAIGTALNILKDIYIKSTED